jgi:hypothetical protein
MFLDTPSKNNNHHPIEVIQRAIETSASIQKNEPATFWHGEKEHLSP